MDVIDYQPTKMLIGTGITDSLVNLDKHGCPSATSNMAEHWKSFKEKEVVMEHIGDPYW